jgi:hypothetical protein
MPYHPTEDILDRVRDIAPSWDRHALVERYRQWSKGKIRPDKPTRGIPRLGEALHQRQGAVII